ncbi:MAG: hypothetical protein OK474_09785 [Thaumarchaeota archaeon]|nr:hypothetical protein [Nitrososphaerota archaeon]
MVEVIEYLLVFGITVSLSAFSVLILGGSLPILGQSQAKAQMDEITAAADLAALKGNTTLILPLSDASLSCSQGVMTFSSGGQSLSSSIASPCSFQFKSVTCLCKLVFFAQDQGEVGLRVDR